MRAFAAGTEDPDWPENHWKTLATTLPYLWPQGQPGLRLRVVLAMVLLLISKLIIVYVPFLYKAAVDSLSGGVTVEGADIATRVARHIDLLAVPLVLIVAYGVARALHQLFAQGRDAIFADVGQHAMRQIALKTFRHVHGLSLRFHLERRTGGLSRVIDRGIKGIDFLLRFTLFNIAPTLIEILLVAGVMFYVFDIWFMLATLAIVAIYVWFTFKVTEWRTKHRRIMNDRDTEANTKAIDSLLNFETVKYFNNEAHESARYDRALAGYQKAAVTTQKSLAFLNGGQGTIIAIGLALVMLMAANGVIAGRLTLGDFVLVNAMLIQLFVPLNLLGSVYREIKQSLIDMETMFNLLDEPAEIEDIPGAPDLTVGAGEIRFEQVSFAYEPERPILRDVSFTLPPGRKLAIVGPSGAGKSTISRLLFRFYDLAAGKITIDGQDISKVTQQSLRAAIGMVPQDTVLFNDTIRYNIRYGRPDASDAEVAEAARHAHIAGFIDSLPKGYEARVGERGLKLSGGEKQRVAIARTLLKSPRILVLDEATSALDTHTEREIQSSLAEIAEGRTTLVIAHRLSTIIDADEILVLEAGSIVERGTHAALLAHNGAYADLWRRQLDEAASASEGAPAGQRADVDIALRSAGTVSP